MTSCNYQTNQSFAEKYVNEDFSEFINTGIHVRGTDEYGDVILFVNLDLKSADKKGPVIIYINRATNTVRETSFKLSDDSVNVDQIKLHKLSIRFLKYKVFSLSVDSNKNVFLGLKESDRPTLARFSDSKYVITADVFKGQWQLIKR